MKIEFEKISSLPDLIVVITLSISLFIAEFYAMNELTMSISAGLLGYIGGSVKHSANDKNQKEE